MKLVRHGPPGAERPGVVRADGALLDLTPVCPDIGPVALAPDALARIARAVPGLSPVPGSPRLGPPVAGIGKIVCTGPNYPSMSRESGTPIPPVPRLYMKSTTAVTGHADPVRLPPWARTAHWEAELAVVIGTTARAVAVESAIDHVAGYCIMNDISDRASESAGGGESVKGRSADGFGPLGPWLVTRDEIGDPHGLRIRTAIAGTPFQDGSTAEMVFKVADLVSYVSRYMTLQPGDVISTGTPGGVGLAVSPHRFLVPGDLIEISIAGLGAQRSPVVA